MTVVASGELSVVHQKMHKLSRNACEADTSRKTCARPSRRGPQLEAPLLMLADYAGPLSQP